MEDQDGHALMQTVDGVLAAFLFAMLIMACIIGLHERLNREKYHFFICHHKADAAAQARYLKMVLQQLKTVHVFIDSDDLRDLDSLFDTIRTSVKNLVLYLTAETLLRPWCVAEVVTSTNAKVQILPVQTPEFLGITAMYIEEVIADVVNSRELTRSNIGAQDIRAALLKLMALP
eukprot:5950472-Amphidinium_carterae.1